MKKIISVSVLMLFVISMITCTANNESSKATKSSVRSVSKVEVYYFHFTRRCVTCQAVETESKKAILALYPAQVKQGKVHFTQVNLDNSGSAALAKKCAVSGQSLLVVGGGKRVDLTDKGFMYARSTPEKLKAELKKVIDPML